MSWVSDRLLFGWRRVQGLVLWFIMNISIFVILHAKDLLFYQVTLRYQVVFIIKKNMEKKKTQMLKKRLSQKWIFALRSRYYIQTMYTNQILVRRKSTFFYPICVYLTVIKKRLAAYHEMLKKKSYLHVQKYKRVTRLIWSPPYESKQKQAYLLPSLKSM